MSDEDVSKLFLETAGRESCVADVGYFGGRNLKAVVLHTTAPISYIIGACRSSGFFVTFFFCTLCAKP